MNKKGGNKINSISGVKSGEEMKITDDLKELAKEETLKEMVNLSKKNRVSLVKWKNPSRTKGKSSKYDCDDELEKDEDEKEEEEDEEFECGKRRRGMETRSSKRAKATTAAKPIVAVPEKPKCEETKKDETPKLNESINIDQARRLVKKVIARNK